MTDLCPSEVFAESHDAVSEKAIGDALMGIDEAYAERWRGRVDPHESADRMFGGCGHASCPTGDLIIEETYVPIDATSVEALTIEMRAAASAWRRPLWTAGRRPGPEAGTVTAG